MKNAKKKYTYTFEKTKVKYKNSGGSNFLVSLEIIVKILYNDV